MKYSAYKLNKQGDIIQPWRTPFPIWNQSVVPRPVLTVVSWPTYRFPRRQVGWSGIPISWKTFQSLLWTTVKGFSMFSEAEVDVFLEFSCVSYDPTDVGKLISGSSPFLNPAWTSGSSQWNIWMLAIDLSYMTFIILRYVPSVPTFWRVFIIYGCWILSKTFLHLLRWSHGFYSSICSCGVSHWLVCRYCKILASQDEATGS